MVKMKEKDSLMAAKPPSGIADETAIVPSSGDLDCGQRQ